MACERTNGQKQKSVIIAAMKVASLPKPCGESALPILTQDAGFLEHGTCGRSLTLATLAVPQQAPPPKLAHTTPKLAKKVSMSPDRDGEEADGENELLGAPTHHFTTAASLLDKLRLEFVSLTKFRNETLHQLSDGHLNSFTSEDDDKLKHVVEDFVKNEECMEAPLVKALREAEVAYQEYEDAQAKVRGECT